MTRFTPQTGIVLALQGAVLALLLERPVNLAVFAGIAALWWAWGGGLRHWRLIALVLILGTWTMMLTQGLFYAAEPRTRWLTLLGPPVFPFGEPPGLHLYWEGLRHGIVQSLRVDAMVLMGAGLLERYGTDRLADGMRALRCPASLAFLFTLALRFIPVMVNEARTIWIAQRLRGFTVLPAHPLSRRRAWVMAPRVWLLPLLAGLVRKADEIAAALLSRGWSPGHGGPVPPTPLGERWLWAAGAAPLIVLGVALALTRLYQAGVFALPWLDWVYDLTARFV